MGKTFRNVIPFGDDFPSTRRDKSRTKARKVKAFWQSDLERRNRRAVATALHTEDWEAVVLVTSPRPLQGTFR